MWLSNQTRVGWNGHFIGCESEAIFRVWSEEKHRVFRVGQASIESGKGHGLCRQLCHKIYSDGTLAPHGRLPLA